MSAPPKIWGESTVRAENTALRRTLSAIGNSSGRLLEVGCGAGRFIRTIKQAKPNLEAHGCDVSPDAICLARRYQDGVNYAVGSLLDLPYCDEEFDIVLIIDVLEHLYEPEKGISEMRRVLKRGGLLHALVPCEGQPFTLHWAMWKLNMAGDLKERHGAHVQRFTRSGVRELFADSGFDLRHSTFSMHPLGQVKDILDYLSRERWFRLGPMGNAVFQQTMRGLWGLAFLESSLLSNLPFCSVVQHITAIKE